MEMGERSQRGVNVGRWKRWGQQWQGVERIDVGENGMPPSIKIESASEVGGVNRRGVVRRR
jgi:hypothetical protein